MPPTNRATPLTPQLAATDVSFQIPLDTASLTYLLDNDDDFLQGVQDSFMSRTPTLSRANKAFEVSQETPRASMSTAIPSSSTIPSTLAHVGPRRSPRKAISKSHVLGLKNECATVGPPSPSRINITAVTSSLSSSSTSTSLSTVQYPASSPPPAIQAAPDFSQPLARLRQLFHKDDWDNYARGDQVPSISAKGKGLVKHPAFANNSNHDSVDFTANGSNPPKKKRTGSSSAHAPSRKRDTTTSATAAHDLSESNDMTDTAAQYRGDSVKKQNVSAPVEASQSPDNNDDKRFTPSESPTRARSSTTEPDLVIDRHNDENKLGLGPIQEHKRNNDGVGQSSASSLSPQRPACVPTNHDAELPPANSPSEEQHSFSTTLVVTRENERGPTDGIRTINSVTAADIAHASTTTIASRDVYHRDDGGQRKPKKVNRVVTVDISKNPSRKRPASLSKRDLQEGRKMHGWRNGSRSQTMDLHSVAPPVEDVHSGCDISAGPNLPSGDVHEFPNVCLTDDITGTAQHDHSTNYTTRSHMMIDIESPSPLADATVTNGIHTLVLEDNSPSPPDEQSPGSWVKSKTNEPPQNMLDPSSSRTRRASHASVSASRKRSSSSREDPMIDGRAIKKRKTTRDGGHGGAVATARIPVRPKSVANLNDEGPRTVSSRPNVNRRNPMPAVKMRTRQENAPKGITRTGAKTSASGVPKQKGVAGKTLEKRKHVAVRPLRPVSIARPTVRKATSSKDIVSKTSPRVQPSCPSSRLNARSQEGQQKKEKLQHLGKELVIDSGVQSIVDMKEGEGGDRTVRLGRDHGPEHLPPALHVATSGSTLAGSGSPPSISQAAAGQIEDVTPDLEYVRPRTRSMTKTTKPVAFSFHTNRRAQERAKFDEIIKAKEAELQRIKEAERLVREEQERKEIKELRMRMIPKAHEVPEWYAHAPRRRPRESTEDNPAVRGAIAATHGRTAGGKAR